MNLNLCTKKELKLNNYKNLFKSRLIKRRLFLFKTRKNAKM